VCPARRRQEGIWNAKAIRQIVADNFLQLSAGQYSNIEVVLRDALGAEWIRILNG
jgi:hypothetical protein